MQRIALFVNKSRDTDFSATKEIISLLKKYNKTVILDVSLKDELDFPGLFFANGDGIFEESDMVIALGGDGTILKTVNQAADYNVPVAGINLGHLGFLTLAERNDLSNLVKILEGDFSVEHRMMLEARITSGKDVKETYTALNDIIIRGNSAKMISLTAEVDGTTAGEYLADGIIVSTSTGSTAYSLSCGGPIVHKNLDCMIMTPICPHTLKSRCIVISPDSTISVKFDASYCSEVDLKIDGSSARRMRADEYIEIVRSKKRVPMISVDTRDYFDVIREKLSD
ncbi:MAG: NAD(+)/NADH kinase [Ruminococcaceae bacterium]|nr:NAD(+)/NADH kinase [Oscillospiraceae bacterium]